MNQSDNDLFCPLPWIGYSIRSDGKVRVCCHANQGPERGILYNSDDIEYTHEDEIQSNRNCNKLKEIRLAILNNEWHSECIRCQKEYILGMRSRNIYESQAWEKYINRNEALIKTKFDGSIDVNKIPIRFFDLRFGNLCNLKCRMCGPGDSNKWYDEHYRILNNVNLYDAHKLVEENGKIIIPNDPFMWHEDKRFWKDLENHIKNMKSCYMVGGEPLLIKKHYDFLEKCISIDKAKDMTIEYNTNLTYIPNDALDIWKKFKVVRFGVSLDGIGKVNDYIRYPSNFDDIVKNIKIVDYMPGNIYLWISCTVMVYNILHLPKFMKFMIDSKFEKIKPKKGSMFLKNHPLHKPYFLSMKIFPKKSKELIKEIFTEEILKLKDYHCQDIYKKQFEHILTNYIRYMNQDDYSHLKEYFISHTHRLDESRNQKLDDYIPELRKLLQ